MTNLFNPIELPTNLLNPYLSDKQMQVHYTGHYLKYISNFNNFLISNNKLKTIYSLVKKNVIDKSFRQYLLLTIIQLYDQNDTIYQNVAQIYNHELYFNSLIDTNQSINMLCKFKNILFPNSNSFNFFYNKFIDMGIKHFGSGWLWIIILNKQLDIITTHDAIIPIKYKICTCIDLWEHAYYIDYEYERKKYLTNIFKLINWNLIYKNLLNIIN